MGSVAGAAAGITVRVGAAAALRARTHFADRLVLVGGASAADDGCWEGLETAADVLNVFNRSDRVLAWAYQTAELFRERPLGLGPAGGQLINVDASDLDFPDRVFRHDYSDVVRELGAPHRWRRSHFVDRRR